VSTINQTGKLLAIALITTFCAASAMAQSAAPAASAAAPAASTWDQNHPRRAEVNSRLANQNARIQNKVADGQMSQAKAQRLHAADKGIRQEERDMAKQNGGHITKGEQKTLNQQENAVSKRIAK
jgi:hypothetical protein